MRAADPEAFAGTDRFVVQRRLGAGSFGVVYEALDRERNARVALKVLRADADRSLYRFKHEFRALADVSHPNLVALYELLSDREQWFFTMERVEGVGFLDHVRGAPPSRRLSGSDFSAATHASASASPSGSADRSWRAAAPAAADSDRLRGALVQLVDGVCALHAAGMLHRDIKPSNVLVTTGGRVVLLDFGLVRELSGDLTQTIETVGTPAYMSPEQAAQAALGEPSDWYSVGVVLYEALTGRLPFSGPVRELLLRKQQDEPPGPGTLVGGVAEDLDALCRELLRRDPSRRPTGPEIQRRLRAAVGSPSPPPAVAAVNTPAFGVAVHFVGRRLQLARLWDAYDVVKSGRATTVGIYGGSGMGKTALVRRFLEQLRAAQPGAVVLSGRCYERETVPFKALDSVVDALSAHLRRLPADEADALLPHDVLALARLFPVLRRVQAVARARRAVLNVVDAQEVRRRAFAALRELLVRVADRHPLIVVIDDLQWGDVDSAALLEGLLRPPDPPALLLVGCYRSDEASTSPLLAVLLPLRESPDAAPLAKVDIDVGALPPEDARTLARALLAETRADISYADVIARESRGNPFLIDELSRFGLGSSARPAAADHEVLDEVIRARVARLPGPARRLLEVVAAAGQPVELEAARHAASLETDAEPALAALRSARLVRTRRTRAHDEIEVYHDRLRGAVLTPLSAADLCHVHESLAAALLASGTADPERLAVHYEEAGQPDTAADYAALAADKAAEALAFDRAATLFQQAVRLRAPQAADHRSLRIRMANALASAGRGREAAEAYLSAVAGAASAERIDLHRRAAQQLLISGHIDEGLRVLRTVLAGLGMTLPGSAGRALASLVLRRMALRLRGLRFRRRDEARITAWELLRIDTCWAVAVGLGHIDMIRGADFQARHLLLALGAGEPQRVGRALALEAAYVGSRGLHARARAERLSAAAARLAEEGGRPEALGLSAMSSGIIAWTHGRWREARELCQRAQAILRERCAGVAWEISAAQMYDRAALFCLGEVAELSRCVAAHFKEAEEKGDLLAVANIRLTLAHVRWLAADDAATAREELSLGLEAWPERMFDFREIWARAARRDIAIYTGVGLGDSEGVAERWRPIARALDRYSQAGLILGLYSRARRRVALAALGPGPTSKELLGGALRHARGIESQRTPWGAPLALLVRAGVAATRGERNLALRLLVDSEAGLRGVEMALHAAAARHRRGLLVGGGEGRALRAEAEGWMAGQAIRNPERMAMMLAPGRWS